ncbi:AraC family transcriptional regulator [Desulfovibrio sp. UCD-KL4C]|uniref:helix-turn-helix domain-containing protein n=1 Tax=Desulfovibrio sp. UCD-KL4C TaxID=2578120 RepID=UPI0025BEA6EE|nr:AraC family transcriptional regulator [Desulfovibrio sp. UCD-KL4C]
MVILNTNNWKQSNNDSKKWLIESQQEIIWEEYQVRNGIKLIVQNIPPLKEPVQFNFYSQLSPIEFMYCLSGDTRLTVVDKDQKEFTTRTKSGKYSLSYLPESKGTSVNTEGTPLQAVGLQFHPESLLHLIDEADRSICPQLYAKIKSHNPRPFFVEAALPLPIQITVQQILECTLSGPMKKIFFEYKTLELMYMQLSLLDCALMKTKKIATYEQQAVMKAYDILMKDLASPPSLLNLAKKVCITHTRLNQLFKTIYGKTVFGVLRQERLECARRMLQGGIQNVTEVAYNCGFSSPSHLSRAFSEQYGLQPKRYQAEHLKQPEEKNRL